MNITSFIIILTFLSPLSAQTEETEKFTSAKEAFEKIQEMILKEHVGNVSEEELYLAATRGMLKALNRNGQNWNALMSPAQLKHMASSLKTEESHGIGVAVKFYPRKGAARIQQILEGSPAEKSGLQVGDQIVRVEGKTYRDPLKMHNKIKGPEGEKVTVTILRNKNVFEKTLVREKVGWSPVISKVSDVTHDNSSTKKVGFLRIRSFTPDSPEVLKEHLTQLNSAQGIVLDLRNNMGGIFDKAVASTDYFLPEGQTIAIIKGKSEKQHTFVSKHPAMVRVPLVVLINRKTSAGAELMAATLKESLGVRLVGEKTYGKWNSQVIRKLPNNYAVRYTVHEIYTPQNHNYNFVGLNPDVRVSQYFRRRPLLKSFASLLNTNVSPFISVKSFQPNQGLSISQEISSSEESENDSDTDPTHQTSKSLQESDDPQLQVALKILKKMI